MTAAPRTRRAALAGRALLALLVAGSSLALVARPADAAVPTTGKAVPGLAAFDSAMTSFMDAHGIPAGVLSVSRGGTVLLERGYGWKDAAKTTQLPPSALLRIASNSKILTARAIELLVDGGQLDWADKVFCTPTQTTGCLLHIEPPPGSTVDSRLDDITVEHLFQHKGGWDTAIRGSDIAFEVKEAAAALGVPSPATKAQLARWAVAQPLDHDPGTVEAYSNIGFVMLGLVIEEVSGKAYIDHIKQALLTPAGTTDMYVGQTHPFFRNPREPNYVDPNTGPDLYDPTKQASLADSYSVATLDSAGGVISSSRAYVKFLEHRFPGPGWDFTTYGSLPGTLSIARVMPSGTHVFAILNAREEPDGDDIDVGQLTSALNAADAAVSTWPTAEVDAVAPTTTVPVASVATGAAPTTSTIPTTVSWTGSDAQSGVARYEVQRKVGSGGFTTVALASPTATSVVVPLQVNQTHTFRIRGIDWAGNQSAWKTGPAVAAKIVDDGAGAITYSTGWTKKTATSALGGSVKTTSTVGKTAKHTFSGKGVALVAPKGPGFGRVQVRVDGVLKSTVELYSSQAKAKTVVWTSDVLPAGSHTVQLTVDSTKHASSTGFRLDLDAFLVR